MDDGEINPMYTMINCLWCTELVEFGDAKCSRCQWEPTDEFWDKARTDECLIIMSPDHYPWSVEEAYDKAHMRFYDSGLHGCNDCMYFGTSLCGPLMDWLGESAVPETPLNLGSIRPCESFITNTIDSRT